MPSAPCHRSGPIQALLTFFLLASSIPGLAQQAKNREAHSENWELISKRNGIRVYRRQDENADLDTFRGVMRMKLKDEYALVALLNDYEAMPKWLHFVDGVTEIKRDGPLERYMRFTTDLPWPLNDREAVIRAKVVQTVTETENSVMIHLSNRPDLIPPNDDYVRFPQLRGVFGFRRLPGDKVEIIYQLVLDPGGYIPTWLVNILMRDTPYFTLLKMRRMLRKPKYHGHYYEYIELQGPGRPDSAGPWFGFEKLGMEQGEQSSSEPSQKKQNTGKATTTQQ